MINETGMVQKPTLLVVDTNCFLRLLDWGPRPLVGQTVANFRLVTTEKLVAECQSSDLHEKYPKLAELGIQRELKAATQKFPPREKQMLKEETEQFRQQANAIVEAHCNEQRTAVRTLSMVDASLWATTVHLNGALATDEWPLTMAAKLIPYDDDGNCIKVFSSVHILHLLEAAGKLNPNERWNMMRQWRREGEGLHRDADMHYRQLFGEPPPTAKSPEK